MSTQFPAAHRDEPLPQRLVDTPSLIQHHQSAKIIDEGGAFARGYRLKLALIGIGSGEGDPEKDEAGVVVVTATILTDNGIQFAEQPRNRNTIYSRPMRFDMICEANGIEHRLTKTNHPWTNGQVERMNRTIKEATVKRFRYENHDQLRTHLADFLAAYNFARRIKTLNGLTPYEYICKIWTSEPDRFILNPIHQMPGLNT